MSTSTRQAAMYYRQYDMAVDFWSPWLVVALVIVAACWYCVFQLWRGMRPDGFEQSLRRLRREPGSRLRWSRAEAPTAAAHSTQNAAQHANQPTGVLQISLLPLMLISCGMAMLLAQAQQPDEFSRPFTWALFVGVGAWYGTTRWRRRRGVGPLRNLAWSGATSAMAVSGLLWAFYMAVDAWRGDTGYERLTGSGATLLWWIAVGSALGALLGAHRAGSLYRRAFALEPDVGAADLSDKDMSALASLPLATRPRRAAWGAIWLACGASLMFHLSAAPQVYRTVRVREWRLYDWRFASHRPRPLVLTMAAARPGDINLPIPLSLTDDLVLDTTHQFQSTIPLLSEQLAEQVPNANAPIPFLAVAGPVKAGQPLGAVLHLAYVPPKPHESPQRYVPPDAVTDPAELTGMVARVDLARGAAISRGDLVSAGAPSPAVETTGALAAETAAEGVVDETLLGNVATANRGEPRQQLAMPARGPSRALPQLASGTIQQYDNGQQPNSKGVLPLGANEINGPEDEGPNVDFSVLLLFGSLDQDRNGLIRESEYTRGVRMPNVNWPLSAAQDIDQDGMLSPLEFQHVLFPNGLPNPHVRTATETGMLRTFELLDLDGNGLIGKAEFTTNVFDSETSTITVLPDLAWPLPRAQDTNQDGMLTLAEFSPAVVLASKARRSGAALYQDDDRLDIQVEAEVLNPQ
ncbi:MAG: hypothetical protein KDB14_33925 [Planctomycetales bacterium]|nr:hypothetical protein [Planctomycetales bacterium]